jgi:hypothetical protein
MRIIRPGIGSLGEDSSLRNVILIKRFKNNSKIWICSDYIAQPGSTAPSRPGQDNSTRQFVLAIDNHVKELPYNIQLLEYFYSESKINLILFPPVIFTIFDQATSIVQFGKIAYLTNLLMTNKKS